MSKIFKQTEWKNVLDLDFIHSFEISNVIYATET